MKNWEKAALVVTFLLAATSLVPACEYVATLSLRSVSILSTFILLAEMSTRGEKFILETLQVLAVMVSLAGLLGLGGNTYARALAIGSLGFSILCRIGIVAIEQDEEEKWRGFARIVVSLLVLGALVGESPKLLLTASVMNLMVLGYIIYQVFTGNSKEGCSSSVESPECNLAPEGHSTFT